MVLGSNHLPCAHFCPDPWHIVCEYLSLCFHCFSFCGWLPLGGGWLIPKQVFFPLLCHLWSESSKDQQVCSPPKLSLWGEDKLKPWCCQASLTPRQLEERMDGMQRGEWNNVRAPFPFFMASPMPHQFKCRTIEHFSGNVSQFHFAFLVKLETYWQCGT